jgi:hypothetical protein
MTTWRMRIALRILMATNTHSEYVTRCFSLQQCLNEQALMLRYTYTGLFISPSGISDPCGTVAGMVTPKGGMLTEGQTLHLTGARYVHPW